MLSTLIIYLLIGLLFTVLRSNAHYYYFVEGSYWRERCLPYAGVPISHSIRENGKWCLDKDNNFITYKPSRIEWYTRMFYFGSSGYNGDFIGTLLLWPLHFVPSFDLIHFRGGIPFYPG